MENKEQALEEAAKSKYGIGYGAVDSINAFIEGAKWQQEQDKNKYNSQEVEKIAKDAYSMGRNNILIGVFNKWFDQFKKK